MSSLASKNPFVGGGAYCASKTGLNAFSEVLMQELRYDNIRVSYVLPGSVATGFSGRASEAGADWKLHPDDVARAIVDLLEFPPRSLPSRVEIRPSRPSQNDCEPLPTARSRRVPACRSARAIGRRRRR